MKTDLKQKFKNLSLKKKLLLFYSVLFLLPLLLISIIIYTEVSQSMLEKIQFSATQGYEQSKSYLEYNIQKKENEPSIPATGMAVLRQQYVLVEAIQAWISSLNII